MSNDINVFGHYLYNPDDHIHQQAYQSTMVMLPSMLEKNQVFEQLISQEETNVPSEQTIDQAVQSYLTLFKQQVDNTQDTSAEQFDSFDQVIIRRAYMQFQTAAQSDVDLETYKKIINHFLIVFMSWKVVFFAQQPEDITSEFFAEVFSYVTQYALYQDQGALNKISSLIMMAQYNG